MKKFLEKLYSFFAFSKVCLFVLGTCYAIFWFYRFFNLPHTSTLASIFDLPSKIYTLPLETFYVTSKGNEVEFAYFINAFICVFASLICSICASLVEVFERDYEIRSLKKRKELEDKVNAELQKEYISNVSEYNFFSFYLELSLYFQNEVFAMQNYTNIDEVLKKNYNDVLNYIKKEFPLLSFKNSDNHIFVSSGNIMHFEAFLSKILNKIKELKIENRKYFLDTKFFIIIDAQNTKTKSLESYKKLLELAKSKYNNTAVITSEFKLRFDLLESKKYEADILGIMGEGQCDVNTYGDLYYLRTKTELI